MHTVLKILFYISVMGFSNFKFCEWGGLVVPNPLGNWLNKLMTDRRKLYQCSSATDINNPSSMKMVAENGGL